MCKASAIERLLISSRLYKASAKDDTCQLMISVNFQSAQISVLRRLVNLLWLQFWLLRTDLVLALEAQLLLRLLQQPLQ